MQKPGNVQGMGAMGASRRRMLAGSAATAGVLAAAGLGESAWALAGCSAMIRLTASDEAFLEDLEKRACLYFWEQASATTGQVLDRARNDMNGARDPRPMASIAATGFGLAALCIADQRGYLDHAKIVERVKTTLSWHLNTLPHVHGFFYHFNDVETGARYGGCELSSIDTALLLCGVLTAGAYFSDSTIQQLAHQIYDRVDWPWMLNGGGTFSMGWTPEKGFLDARWKTYCELMMIYLLAMGAPTHAVSADVWNNFSRPHMQYAGYDYISGNDPLFTHQYSQAWFDFRSKRDKYANYFNNSVTATRAHKAFCLSYPKWYSDNYWGVSASDSAAGYQAWGGPPALGELDGSVVPCAVGGSLSFVPTECLAVLRSLKSAYGAKAWGRYGFVDAFHPAANWYDPDVLGIDQGIMLLMAENMRSGLIWKTFMKNAEAQKAMAAAGFLAEA